MPQNQQTIQLPEPPEGACSFTELPRPKGFENPSSTQTVIRESLPADKRDEWRKRGKESLFFFAKGILGFKDLVPHIHGPICQMLENKQNRNIKVVLPRTWFKSTICSIAYPIWELVNNPNLRILIAQNTFTNAAKKLNEISEIFKRNMIFRSLYPELLPSKDEKWTSETIQVPRELTAPEGSIEVAGVKTKLIGRHFDIIIEDDTVAPDYDEYGEENIAPTKEDIGLAIGWHKLITPFFVDPKNNRNVVVGTRWFEKDLMSYIDDNEHDLFQCYERGILETAGVADEFGEPAWPERFDRSVVDAYRRRSGPYMFSCLYLNKPVASATQLFKMEWFTYFDTEERDLIITTTVDPGGDPEDTKGRPDYNVVCTTGKSLTTGLIYVLEITRGFWNPSQLINEIFRHVRKWSPVQVGVEAQQYQKSLLHWIREKQQADTTWFRCTPITNNRKSKNSRISGLQPLVESKSLLFRPSQAALVSELISFPNGANDDMADALSMHLPLWLLTQSKDERPKEQEPGLLSFDKLLQDMEGRKSRLIGEVNPVFDQLGGLPISLEDILRN